MSNLSGSFSVFPRKKNKPRRDPLIIASEKAYHASNQFALDKLLRQERLFKTRLTKALSGLDRTQKSIQTLLRGLAESRMSEQAGRGKQ